ncbi:MAG: hypothetical protein R6W80_00825, partial [Haliea sp.]
MNKLVRYGIVCGSAAWAAASQAQQGPATDVGQVLVDQGAPQFIVDAGNAIRATCLELGADGPQTGQRLDLFSRCREMSVTVLGAANNSYNFSDLSDTYNAIRQFSGEEASSQSRLATESSNRQFVNLGARMDAIRRGARSTISPVAFNVHGMDLNEALAGNPPPLAGGTGAG